MGKTEPFYCIGSQFHRNQSKIPYFLMICLHWTCQRNQHIIECLVYALKKTVTEIIVHFHHTIPIYRRSDWEREREWVRDCRKKEITATHNYHHNHYPSLMRAIKKRHSPFIKRKCHCCNFDIIPSSIRHGTVCSFSQHDRTAAAAAAEPTTTKNWTQRRCRDFMLMNI